MRIPWPPIVGYCVAALGAVMFAVVFRTIALVVGIEWEDMLVGRGQG